MQYSLLHSSSIVQHFSFHRMKLFQLKLKLYFFRVFLSKKNKIAAISTSSSLDGEVERLSTPPDFEKKNLGGVGSP